jgi:ferredoxin--NADP+ reductase
VGAKILSKENLAGDVLRMKLEAPLIASQRKAGQFVILRVTEGGERFPLTIADSFDQGITIIYQVVGKSTQALGALEVGDEVMDLVGPLGKPTHIEDYGHVACVGGGIGVAPLFPMAQAMKNAGNKVTSVIGSRTKDLLILEDEMKGVSDRLEVATDDGSYGFHGFVTQVLEQVLEESGDIKKVLAVGPVPMMKATCAVTKKFEVPTEVSLNPIMVDGTGMCGGCRVTVGGETKFACVDGPEFDGHLVDFDELTKRLGTYKGHEDKCKLEGVQDG